MIPNKANYKNKHINTTLYFTRYNVNTMDVVLALQNRKTFLT